MAKLTTIAEACDTEDGEIVMAVRGKLTKLYDRKTGMGEHGEWSLQGGELTDQTGVIKLTFSGRDAVPKDLKGKTIQISASKHEKHGWTGVKKETYKDKAQLKVTSSAEVINFDAENQPEEEEPKQTPQTARKNSEEGKQGPHPSESGTQSMATGNRPPENLPAPQSSAMDTSMGTMIQIANCQYAARRVVKEYLVPALRATGDEPDAVEIAALIQNMLIQGYRSDVHRGFPKTRFLDKKQAPKNPPKNSPKTMRSSTDVPVDDTDFGSPDDYPA